MKPDNNQNSFTVSLRRDIESLFSASQGGEWEKEIDIY